MNEDKTVVLTPEELAAQREADKKEREEKLKTKDLEIVEMISNADGRQLFQFMVKLKKDIGNGAIMSSERYMRLCHLRAVEINKNRYGSWNEAKVNFDHTVEPSGIFQVKELTPILGYPVQFVPGENKSYMVMMNPKLNTSYIRECGGTTVSYAQAKKIFSS